ncbi:putative Response regulator of the LytR/AlgR family [Vibrio nigripulchritudo MADA3029]|uniref:LytR/AlgR family response regulator transcription factor n=1 Tax=Vibrio nigripulchritudo TaxID=28173 RepID=UPI0003B207AA|nr:LytTR family DNA-binding domain-containing protein [Vibrio nigripulchritudo]KJY76521.1 chemotaxis protein CheY [Vibrio nigripulchritudo]CCN36903.1 putative Response regulator of the LytR/AlgR family [Vibrio nigripulchritudo AM115]CCN41126.1 putative Response regulator of the LytR/AlgR family [Vibrio nigripulchritudo FTn2]CCN47259.1 putative Response regulator of the LytR/AlgR family [Vibrio nigripulchritudo MADA3020]CCN52537.1 putative Response regulator of the LytR/AlgR family [Vibrio nigr
MAKYVKAVIADDEPLLLHHLQRQLNDVWLELDIVAKVGDGKSAFDAILEHEPDVVFLDIRMPGLDGITLANKLNKLQHTPHIVFTTAYDEYAVEAFDNNATDYLLKPINEERLTKAVAKVQQRLNDHQTSSQPDLQKLFEQLSPEKTQPQSYLHWIKASMGDEIHLIPIDDVVYFKSEDKYVSVYCQNGESHLDEYLIRMSLKELLEQLDPNQFWQIHRSTIVSVSRISKVRKDLTGRMYVVIGQKELPVSRASQSLFKGM